MQPFSCRPSPIAVVIMEYARSTLLKAIKFAKCNVSTIRCKLLKIASVIVFNTRRYVFRLSSSCPYKEEIFVLFGYYSSAHTTVVTLTV